MVKRQKKEQVGVCQFRMWVSNEKRYCEKSLLTQRRAEANDEKLNNYALAKQVGIEVEQRKTEEEWDVAYKRRVISVTVSRKNKVTVDAISNEAKGMFP